MNYIVLDLEWNQSPNGKELENPHLPFEIIDSLCVTPNLCCSSITASWRFLYCVFLLKSAWVPITMSMFPSLRAFKRGCLPEAFKFPVRHAVLIPAGSKSLAAFSACGSKNCALSAVVNCTCADKKRHKGFSRAHISLQKPLHGKWRLWKFVRSVQHCVAFRLAFINIAVHF